MVIKTLFDAVETELKNAHTAISNADRYLDALKEVAEIMAVKIATGDSNEDEGEYLKQST